jgi:hypothetical protein
MQMLSATLLLQLYEAEEVALDEYMEANNVPKSYRPEYAKLHITRLSKVIGSNYNYPETDYVLDLNGAEPMKILNTQITIDGNVVCLVVTKCWLTPSER